MTFTYHVPDPFLLWIWKQFLRIGASLLALGIIAFLLSLVFRAVASMIEALHEVLHQVLLFCQSINHTFAVSGLLGQFLMCLISISIFVVVIVPSIQYLIKNWRNVQ